MEYLLLVQAIRIFLLGSLIQNSPVSDDLVYEKVLNYMPKMYAEIWADERIESRIKRQVTYNILDTVYLDPRSPILLLQKEKGNNKLMKNKYVVSIENIQQYEGLKYPIKLNPKQVDLSINLISFPVNNHGMMPEEEINGNIYYYFSPVMKTKEKDQYFVCATKIGREYLWYGFLLEHKNDNLEVIDYTEWTYTDY